MTENCRKKMAMSFVLTLADPNVGRENSFPFSRTDPGVMRSRRNCCSSTSLLAAVRSPLIFSPDALLPENVKTGMVTLSSLRLEFRSVTHRRHDAGGFFLGYRFAGAAALAIP